MAKDQEIQASLENIMRSCLHTERKKEGARKGERGKGEEGKGRKGEGRREGEEKQGG